MSSILKMYACQIRKYRTPMMPGTNNATQRPMLPTFSVKLAFHPVNILVASSKARKMRMISSAVNEPGGNGRTETGKKNHFPAKVGKLLDLRPQIYFLR